MIAAISFGALGLVFVVAAWSRFRPGRSQRRSVEEHQHALDVLGEVAKRRDGIAQVHAPSPEEIGRAHVHTTEDAAPRFRRASTEDLPGRRPSARLVLRSGPKPLKLPFFDDAARRGDSERPQVDVTGLESEALASASSRNDAVGFEPVVRFDADDVDAVARRPYDGLQDEAPLLAGRPLADQQMDSAQSRGRPTPPLSPPKPLRAVAGRNPFFLRRVATVAAIVIVLAAVGVGSWQLATSKSSPRRAAAPPPTTPHKSHHVTKSHPGSSTSVAHEITPTSTSQNIVTFPLSASSFTITFSSTAPCWIGILPSQRGPYVWMTTVEAGTTTTYHANAPVFVRIGAPQYVVVKVDGVRLALPPKKIQPYDVTFTVGSSISA